MDTNPFEAPHASLAEHEAEAGALSPLPFEDLAAEPRFWPRVWAMFSLLFRSPRAFFLRVPATTGFSAPWRFQLLLLVPYLLLSLAMMLLFMGFVPLLSKGDPSAPPSWLLHAIFGGMSAALLVLTPLMAFLGMVVGGAILHGLLWLWGGVRPGAGLPATIRATGYASAFLALASAIPMVGAFAALGAPVLLGYGLARIHRCDTWRGICACYTPLLLCCCSYAALFALALRLGSAS
jgi:hypothetical protein